MTLLITSDWHLSANPRDEYRWGFIEKYLPQFVEAEGVELPLFLGDICEVKDSHPAELVNRVVKAFHQLSKHCQLIILEGNHDWLSDPANPYFGFLPRLGNISWVGQPTPLASIKGVPEAFSRACKAILLPHSANYERDWGEINFRQYDWAFAHQSFAGAKSESGFELGGVPLSYFPKNLRIVSGDIHKPQTWGPLTYVGSPYCIDFGDEIEPRLLLWDKGDLVSVPVPGPQKRLITLSGEHPFEGIVSPLNKGDIIKVRANVSTYDEWPPLKAQIEAWAAKRGLVLHQALPLVQAAPSTKSLRKKPTQSDEEIIRAFSKKRQLAEGYVNTGIKLL